MVGRVLHIGKFYPPHPGGIESVVQAQAEALVAAGVQCDVLVCTEGPSLVESINGVTVIRCAQFGILQSTSLSFRLIRELWKRRRNYAIVHIHLPNPLANLAIWLCRPTGAWVLQWHSDIIRQKLAMLLYRPWLLWLVHRSARIVVPTETHVKQSDFASELIPKHAVVPFFIDEEKFSPAPGIHVLDPQHIRLLSVGRFVSYKGFEFLIDAIKLLPNIYTLRIVGRGPLEQTLNARVKRLGIADRVTLSYSDDLSVEYNRADIFVLPAISKAEMYGVVLLEAMLFGLPLVSTDIQGSGITQVNCHGESGLIVPPKDPAALAGAVLQITADPMTYKAFSERSRSRLNKFARPAAIAGLIDEYQKIVKPSPLS